MRIFVTGASGVIGRRLVPILVGEGHAVTAVARSSASRALLVHLGASAMNVDLFDAPGLTAAVADHEAVINLATHIPDSSTQMFLPWAWRENDRLRRVTSGLLVDACLARRVPRLIQESFAPVYPDHGDRWIDESMPIAPVRYNRSVADAEASANRFTQTGNIGVVLRFGSFYGPDATQLRELVAWIKRGWAPLPGPAGAYLSSVSHDDAASAVAMAIALPAGIYNVVDDTPLTHRQFVDSLAAALETSPPRLPPPWLTPMFGSVGEMLARSVRISNRKLRAASVWAPRYASVRQGWNHALA